MSIEDSTQGSNTLTLPTSQPPTIRNVSGMSKLLFSNSSRTTYTKSANVHFASFKSSSPRHSPKQGDIRNIAAASEKRSDVKSSAVIGPRPNTGAGILGCPPRRMMFLTHYQLARMRPFLNYSPPAHNFSVQPQVNTGQQARPSAPSQNAQTCNKGESPKVEGEKNDNEETKKTTQLYVGLSSGPLVVPGTCTSSSEPKESTTSSGSTGNSLNVNSIIQKKDFTEKDKSQTKDECIKSGKSTTSSSSIGNSVNVNAITQKKMLYPTPYQPTGMRPSFNCSSHQTVGMRPSFNYSPYSPHQGVGMRSSFNYSPYQAARMRPSFNYSSPVYDFSKQPQVNIGQQIRPRASSTYLHTNINKGKSQKVEGEKNYYKETKETAQHFVGHFSGPLAVPSSYTSSSEPKESTSSRSTENSVNVNAIIQKKMPYSTPYRAAGMRPCLNYPPPVHNFSMQPQVNHIGQQARPRGSSPKPPTYINKGKSPKEEEGKNYHKETKETTQRSVVHSPCPPSTPGCCTSSSEPKECTSSRRTGNSVGEKDFTGKEKSKIEAVLMINDINSKDNDDYYPFSAHLINMDDFS